MKRFSFSLESVRRWRESALLQEEAKYKLLAAQQAEVNRRLIKLHEDEFKQRQQIADCSSTTGVELQHLDSFTSFSLKIGKRLESEIARLRRAMETQTAEVSKARQELELLQRLKEREQALWKVEFEKDLQVTADEAFSAGLQRRKLRR